MPAAVIAIADAVAAALNAATLSQSFLAVRSYVPVHDLKDLATLRVTVVPRELSMARLSRRDDDFDYVIDVAVQKAVWTGPWDDGLAAVVCDPLMELAEEIVDLFRGHAIDPPAAFPASFVGASNVPIFAPDHLDERRVFTSVVSLRFKKVRAR